MKLWDKITGRDKLLQEIERINSLRSDERIVRIWASKELKSLVVSLLDTANSQDLHEIETSEVYINLLNNKYAGVSYKSEWVDYLSKVRDTIEKYKLYE